MPWSDWQTPEDYDLAADALRVEANIQSHDPAEPGIVQPFIANLDLQSLVYRDNTGQTIGRHDLLQFSAPSIWQTHRSWFPALLSGLVEGVDYAVRPDKNPATDDDAYVEYQDGPNVDIGWLMPVATVTSPMVTVDDVTLTPVAGSGAGTLEVLPSSYPTAAGTSIGPMPTGTTILTESPGGAPSVTPADPGVLSFSFVTATASVDIPLNSHIGWTVTFAGRPQQHVQSPPWRYWIPDTTTVLPLRQRQRDDGLGMNGVARWRGGSSRQTSNRWRAYL